MAYKYREDLVGKRFIAVSGLAKINVNKVSEWGWKAGLIRAASLKDNKNKELQMKSKALGKDEVICLVDLISKHPILTSKATNATNNKLKDEAWKAIAHEFSAISGEMRRPEQLRLKWENLKKAARKRNATIRENNLKTGGGKIYIPPDEALDRVASILGATCSGYTVEFGGDSEPGTLEVIDIGSLASTGEEKENGALVEGGSGCFKCGGGGEIETNFTPKRFLFNTPKNSLNKRRKLSEEVQRARRDKDLSLAAYFQAKADRINLENIKLKLEIEQLKNNVHSVTPVTVNNNNSS